MTRRLAAAFWVALLVSTKRTPLQRVAYHAYLGSSTWHARSVATLRRAEFVCEACVDALATQAHHVTYVRVGRERSSDLLALCAPCHRRLHGRNR